MEDFRKIDLGTPSNMRTSRMRSYFKFRYAIPKKNLRLLLALLAIFLVGSFFMIVLPAQKTYSSAMKTKDQARKVYEALKKQNIELADEELKKTKKDLEETTNNLHSMGYLRFVPIAGWYYSDADHLVKAGTSGLLAAEIFIDSLKPYADVLGLKGNGSFVMGSAEQRIQTAILTMGKITPRIDDIAKYLVEAQKELDQVSPNHYPSLFGGAKVKKQLETAQTVADQGVVFVEEARPLIKVLPSLLGEKKERKYLVLFQNDKELRPTGGFITADAIFRIDKGIVHVERSEDIYKLDDSIRRKPKAPDPILKYLPKVNTFNLRDSNLSPDFIVSMKQFRELYDLASSKVEVDGIIALDTHVLVSTIKILDDEVIASGIKFNTKTDKRCDCPQVIYVLEDNISRPVGYIKENRKGLLGDLLYAIMEKALKSSPKTYWGPLFQEMLTQTSQKHVLFYIFNKDAQSGIESLNAAGRIKPFEGDYLHVNEANFSGGKANMYVRENVEQAMKVDRDGTITKTVTIKYKNSYPPSDCNLERGGLCLNAPLRNWLRIYVPKGSQMTDTKGSEVKMTTKEEFGKTVFEGFLTVRPLGAATFTITYTLPFKLAAGSELPLLMQKQPGTEAFDYTINLNGRQVQQFKLATDKEVKLRP